MFIIKNKKRFLLPILLVFLFISVDLFTPSLVNRFSGNNQTSIVYAKPKTSSSGFKSGSFKSSTKSSGGFKSGSFSTPKSSSSSKSSSGSSSFGSSGSGNYSSGSSTKRSILPIPIPIPWGSGRYYGSGFNGIGAVGSFFGGIFRLILLIIVIIVIYKIIKNSRRRF